MIEDTDFPSINRSVVILEFKQPYIDWINSIREEEELKKKIVYTMEEINDDPRAYLIPEISDPPDLEIFLERSWIMLFELQLSGWVLDEEPWPRKRTRKMFDQWFNVKCSSLVVDLWGKEPLEHQM